MPEADQEQPVLVAIDSVLDEPRGHAGSTTLRTPELLRGMYLSFQNCDRLSRLSKPDRAEFLEMFVRYQPCD